MRTTTLLCAVGVLGGLIAVPAFAADYFVATDGDNANPGTLAKPLKDPVQAAKKLMPGDTLLFRAGQYVCETNSTVGLAPSRDGEPGKPITFTTHNHEPVLITGKSDWNLTPNGYSYIVFDGFEVTGRGHYGMKISAGSGGRKSGHHITVRNCEVHHSAGENIFAHSTEFLTIENCWLHDSDRSHGLYLQVGCHHAVVRRVTSENNQGNSGIQLNAAGGGLKDALVKDCLIRGNAQGLSLMQLQDSVIRGNVLYNDCFEGPRGSGHRGIILWTYDESGNKGQPCSGVLIEHNTIVNTRTKFVNHLLDVKVARDMTIRNNILVLGAALPLMTVAPGSEAGLKFEGNLWQTPAGFQVQFDKEKLPLDKFLAQIGSPATNVQGDPKLAAPDKGDFTPERGSSAIGQALPATQPEAGGRWTDLGAVWTARPRQIGCKLPWKHATTRPD